MNGKVISSLIGCVVVIAGMAVAAKLDRQKGASQSQGAMASSETYSGQARQAALKLAKSTNQYSGGPNQPQTYRLPPPSRNTLADPVGYVYWPGFDSEANTEEAASVQYQGDNGALNMSLDPEFTWNRMVYLTYLEPHENGTGVAVMRARVSDDGSTMSDPVPIVVTPPDSNPSPEPEPPEEPNPDDQG
ncbi:MAG: PQQ-dependent sugar dehydrogenase [bacterium]